MSSQVTVRLSDALYTQLNVGGVFVYAVAFDSSGAAPVFTKIIEQPASGTTTSNQSITIPTDTYSSGKIYFLVQSQTAATAAADLPTVITSQSDINWSNASTYNFRFDSVELNSAGSSTDVANLTDVNAYGLPMSISNGLTGGTRGYNASGATIFSDIFAASAPGTNMYDYSTTDPYAGPLTGPRMAAGPTDATAAGFPTPPAVPFSRTDWTNYVNAVKTGPQITISGWFNGAPDANNVWHDAGYYSYKLSWDGTYFWLKPEGISQIKGSIRFLDTSNPAPGQPDTGLINDIYATYGTADIIGPKGDTFLSQMNVGANNQWGAVLRDFVTGFTAGYYGATGTSPNGAAHGSNINLSNNANWDPTYLFGNNTTSAFGASAGYDKYAAVFNNNSNSYGAGYADNLTKALSVGPLLSLWNGTTNTDLTVTLFADADTPASAQYLGANIGMGYQTPVINNYVAPPIGGYGSLTDIGGSATFSTNNITFNFAGSNVFLDTASTVTLGFYNGTGFTTINLPTTQASFWNTYTLQYTPGQGFSFSSAVNPQTPGSINITNLPVISDGTAGWYQLTVTGAGANAWSKTFNFYATTSGGEFVNPNLTAGAAAIDGLAVTQAALTGATVNSLTFALLTGSGYSLDQSVIARNTTVASISNMGDATYTSPFAPVIGTVNGTTFTNFMATPGVYTAGPTPNAYKVDATGRVNPTSFYSQSQIDGQTVNTNLVTYELASTIAKSKIAFSWWGADAMWLQANANQVSLLNHDPGSDIIWDGTAGSLSRWNTHPDATNGLVQGYGANQYTNKIGALNTAMIKFIGSDASGNYTKHAPIIVQSNLDGVWNTKNTLFLDGTYKAVLLEYSAGDKAFTQQLNKASDGIVFSIDSSGGGGSIGGGGSGGSSGITYTGSGEGAWVRLDSTMSTLTNGTLFVYFTNGSGALLDRNDGVTSSLQDAIRAEIGLVKTDGGTLMFNGVQSVYLPTGMTMKFAIQVGNGDIKALPDIQVSGTGTLSVSVSDSSGVLNLSAVMDRSPGPNAGLALSQHEFDRAWVYLTQGDTVKVDVAGSAYNNNTLHFVRIDVDSSDPSNSAGWSVGGVAWGNTDAFRAAVQANWDANYSASGGRGNFQDTKNFTASASGFYAPVLTTEGRDTFVLGTTANVDGREHIRVYGQNMFGFEDNKGGDWDYNDLVMKITTT